MSIFPTKVLLATDGSKDAALAAKAAVDLSSKTGSELHVVHVGKGLSAYSQPASMPRKYSGLFAEQAEELLEKQIEIIRHSRGTVRKAHLRLGRPVEEIVGLNKELGAGLIVMGSRGLGVLDRLVMGSVSEGVVHHAMCPVLVVRGGESAWPPSTIVFGDDSSQEATEAGELAASIGKLFGANLLLVQAYPELPTVSQEENALDARMVEDALRQAENALQERAREFEGALGRGPEVRMAVGDATALILGEAQREKPYLIAVGSRGLGTLERTRRGYAMLGSVSTKVMRAAHGPVLVCPRRRIGGA